MSSEAGRCKKIRFANLTAKTWATNNLRSEFSFKCCAVIAHENGEILCEAVCIITNLPGNNDHIYGDDIVFQLDTCIKKFKDEGIITPVYDDICHKAIRFLDVEYLSKSTADLYAHCRRLTVTYFENLTLDDFVDYCTVD